MKLRGKCLLGSALMLCVAFPLLAGLAGSRIPAREAETETAVDTALLDEETVDEMNQKLEEENADLAIRIVEVDNEISGATNTTAMAGLAVVTETLESDEYAVSLLNEEDAEEASEDAEEPAEDAEEAEENTEETEETEEEPEEEPWTDYELLFADKVMANPDMINTEALNVRSAASTDAEVVGKLYVGAWATITATQDNWYQITSGNVSGWVCADYCLTGKEAAAFGKSYGYYVGTVNTERLNVRASTSADSDCIGQLTQGEIMQISSLSDDETWAAIAYGNTVGYVSTQYLDLQYVLSSAMTVAEEQAYLEEQARIARDSQVAATIDATAAGGGTNRGITYVSYEDLYLIASVVEMEVGGVSYDEKLAVANVILNRYYSGAWGSSFSSVIYAQGQFTGANTGVLASYMAAGPSAASLQAVYAACAGYNNIGGYMYFCTLGKASSVHCTSSMVFYNMYLYQL